MTKESENQNPNVNEQAQQALQQVLERSAVDAEFREKLLNSPQDALSSHPDLEIPDDLDIDFVDSDAKVTHVLPNPVDEENELNEEELETVAGGGTPLYAAAGALVAVKATEVVTEEIDAVEDDGDGHTH